MKQLILCIAILLASIQIYPQGADSLSFINNLGEKEKATFGDAVALFMYTTNRMPKGFVQDSNILRDAGILRGMAYEEQKPLRRGILARIVARHMNLQGSLLYIIFGTERYAYTACVDRGVMDPDMSEWDVLSGEELIEVLARMSEILGGGQ